MRQGVFSGEWADLPEMLQLRLELVCGSESKRDSRRNLSGNYRWPPAEADSSQR